MLGSFYAALSLPGWASSVFSLVRINSVKPVFREKAERLRDILLQLADEQAALHVPQAAPVHNDDTLALLCSPALLEPAHHHASLALERPKCVIPVHLVVDVLVWLTCATLDVIGEAGFSYAFHVLPLPGSDPHAADTVQNELACTFAAIFSTARKFRMVTVFTVRFPVLCQFHPNTRTMQEACDTMHRIGTQLISEHKTEHVDTKSRLRCTTFSPSLVRPTRARISPSRKLINPPHVGHTVRVQS
ncbi:hypothetical protein BC834DRAFT_975001 [Gloeopeniophorella convolvens]|nr:hypothetical protein BC834DRAFT_975001 [Gloeopeniophorella convolvens]